MIKIKGDSWELVNQFVTIALETNRVRPQGGEGGLYVAVPTLLITWNPGLFQHPLPLPHPVTAHSTAYFLRNDLQLGLPWLQINFCRLAHKIDQIRVSLKCVFSLPVVFFRRENVDSFQYCSGWGQISELKRTWRSPRPVSFWVPWHVPTSPACLFCLWIVTKFLLTFCLYSNLTVHSNRQYIPMTMILLQVSFTNFPSYYDNFKSFHLLKYQFFLSLPTFEHCWL